jgi:hypothetical protein
VIAHPTHILRTTRIGSRSPVPWLNQPRCQDKGEPKRRNVVDHDHVRIVEPGAKTAIPGKPWTDASLLLVILHYLLKNNIRIYEDDMCRLRCPPSASADTTKSTVGGI